MPLLQRSRISLLIIVCLCFVGVGCTVVYDVPSWPVSLPATDPIDLTVALRLDEELCSAKWEKRRMGDHYILPIGRPLCTNAEAAARKVFKKVRKVGDKAAPLADDVDALLVPSLASIERDRPAFISQDQTTSIQFNWSLVDRNGDPIWVTTIAGEGIGPMGIPLQEDAGREQTDMVLRDVFRKSVIEMSGSQLIRDFAAGLP